MKNWILIIGTILLISCNSKPKQYLTDKDIVILEEKISHNKKHKIISYVFDLGAYGDSRVYWAIIPTNFDKTEPINEYIIPDGYKATDWNFADEAILKKWTPYYYKDEEIELKSGDKFENVIIEIQ
jgi:hypothetical protein